MSDAVNQLIAKAMSTTSEDEAIACLRMARKKNGGKNTFSEAAEKSEQLYKGKTIQNWYELANYYYNRQGGSATYNGKTAQQWYEKAAELYRNTQNLQRASSALSHENESRLYRKIADLRRENDKRMATIKERDELIKKMKSSAPFPEKHPAIFVGTIFAGFCIFMASMVAIFS